MQCCYFVVQQEYPNLPYMPEITKARAKVVSLLYIYTFKFQEYFGNELDNSFNAVWSFVNRNNIPTDKDG